MSIEEEVTLVQFACRKGDPVKTYALTDDQFDRWVTGEPPEGYHVFKRVGTAISLVEVTDEQLTRGSEHAQDER